MGNHVKARPRAKPKPKSVKAKITRKMGSKRRTQKMGKELKKGQKGAAASYFTRAKVSPGLSCIDHNRSPFGPISSRQKHSRFDQNYCTDSTGAMPIFQSSRCQEPVYQ